MLKVHLDRYTGPVKQSGSAHELNDAYDGASDMGLSDLRAQADKLRTRHTRHLDFRNRIPLKPRPDDFRSAEIPTRTPRDSAKLFCDSERSPLAKAQH